jgi:hypothetical protein
MGVRLIIPTNSRNSLRFTEGQPLLSTRRESKQLCRHISLLVYNQNWDPNPDGSISDAHIMSTTYAARTKVQFLSLYPICTPARED